MYFQFISIQVRPAYLHYRLNLLHLIVDRIFVKDISSPLSGPCVSTRVIIRGLVDVIIGLANY